MSTTNGKQWHVATWPLLAWLETVVKLAGICTGIAALIEAATGGGLGMPEGARLAQFIIMVVLSIGLIAAIFDRIIEREIVAMLFVLVNNVGHWSVVIALAADDVPTTLIVTFGILLLVGDLLKLAFLATTNFTVRQIPRSVLYGLTIAYVVGYSSLLLLEFAA